MLSIYEYSDAPAFLKDAWSEKREKNPSFSLRAWSKKMGFKNNAPLSLMLAGKRPIPKKYVTQFIHDLDLSDEEGLYLEALVELSTAKSIAQKERCLSRLSHFRPDGVKASPGTQMLEVESFKYLEDPLHVVILEMSDLPGFNPEPRWIQAQLRFERTIQQIESAIERLFALGFLRESDDGRWQKAQPHLTNRVDVKDKGSQGYHRNVSLLASEQVSLQSVLEREFNGYAMNLKLTDIPRAKTLIRDFIQEFIRQVEAKPGDGDATFQFNVQLFSLIQHKTKGESS